MDKFLKVSRLIKRREVAKELCDHGNVSINGKASKPMTEVNSGDTIVIEMGRHTITAKVLDIRPFANKEQSSAMYEIVSDQISEK